MVARIKEFISEKKVFILLLSFFLTWAGWVTGSIYANRSDVKEARQIAESNNKVIQEVMKNAYGDISDIKDELRTMKIDLKDHEKDNRETQVKIYQLLLEINRNMLRK